MSAVPESPAFATPEEVEIRKIMFEVYLRLAKTYRSQEGGASSSNLFNEPEKDKKTPKKKKKEPNKKVEALKKRAAYERAKYLKTVKERKDLELLAKIERREKLAQKRKSLLQKDEETIQMLKEKINNKTAH